jgi:hypothetical protein
MYINSVFNQKKNQSKNLLKNFNYFTKIILIKSYIFIIRIIINL